MSNKITVSFETIRKPGKYDLPDKKIWYVETETQVTGTLMYEEALGVVVELMRTLDPTRACTQWMKDK